MAAVPVIPLQGLLGTDVIQPLTFPGIFQLVPEPLRLL